MRPKATGRENAKNVATHKGAALVAHPRPVAVAIR
jgi:hypothetical protein